MKNQTTERLAYIVTMGEKYPQHNSPSDWQQIREAKAELKARGEAMPPREDQTDFKYRLQKYGY